MRTRTFRTIFAAVLATAGLLTPGPAKAANEVGPVGGAAQLYLHLSEGSAGCNNAEPYDVLVSVTGFDSGSPPYGCDGYISGGTGNLAGAGNRNQDVWAYTGTGSVSVITSKLTYNVKCNYGVIPTPPIGNADGDITFILYSAAGTFRINGIGPILISNVRLTTHLSFSWSGPVGVGQMKGLTTKFNGNTNYTITDSDAFVNFTVVLEPPNSTTCITAPTTIPILVAVTGADLPT